jgi:hypothetical protein
MELSAPKPVSAPMPELAPAHLDFDDLRKLQNKTFQKVC